MPKMMMMMMIPLPSRLHSSDKIKNFLKKKEVCAYWKPELKLREHIGHHSTYIRKLNKDEIYLK
jgi:hypothetical protein